MYLLSYFIMFVLFSHFVVLKQGMTSLIKGLDRAHPLTSAFFCILSCDNQRKHVFSMFPAGGGNVFPAQGKYLFPVHGEIVGKGETCFPLFMKKQIPSPFFM